MSVKKNAVAEAEVKKLLTLVDAMNALDNEIDPHYAKMAVFLKSGEKEVTRFFIQKRPYVAEDGIERWKFIAREGNSCDTDC